MSACAGPAEPPPESAAALGVSFEPDSDAASDASEPDFAPSRSAPRALPRVPELRHPRSDRPWFGVEMRAPEDGSTGVLVTTVFPHSPAERAGLSSGDRVILVDGRAVLAPADLARFVQARGLGESLGVTIERGGATHLLRVELEGTPDFEDRIRLAFVGQKAPEIAGVTTFQGEATSLADVRGKVVVLEFWASFCGVCRYVAPTLDRWHRTYRPQGAEVIGITVDSPTEGAEVAADLGMSYTLASDGAGKTTRTYLASQVPMIVLIDKTGAVRDVMVGYSTPRIQEMEETLRALLGEAR